MTRPGLPHQALEQRELARPQLDRRAAAVDLAGQAIEAQIGDGQRRRLDGALAAPRDRLQARQQLGEGERLGQVVVAAGLQALHAVVDAVPRAQEEHRGGDAGVAQRRDQAEAVEARQHDVDDGGVVRAGARQLESRHAVLGDVDGEALLSQAAGDEAGDAAIVFDDEDAHVSPAGPAALCGRRSGARTASAGTLPGRSGARGGGWRRRNSRR